MIKKYLLSLTLKRNGVQKRSLQARAKMYYTVYAFIIIIIIIIIIIVFQRKQHQL